jgi:F0F1-type ATP synthase membrane subunit b/b'
MPQFDSDTFIPQLFWLGILFAVFYWTAQKVLVPRMQKILHVRQKKIDSILKDAEQTAKESEALRQQLDEKRDAVHLKIDQKLEKVRREQLKIYQKYQAQLAQELTEFLQHQEADIKSHESKLLGAMLAEKRPLVEKARKIFEKEWGGQA